jgi:SAM-dependent methyltransferase
MFCRICKRESLHVFLDLGFTPPADAFLRKEQLHLPETYYPLQVALCDYCGLAQLTHVVSPEVLYRHDYPYESSTTATGQQHWTEFAASCCRELKLTNMDLVIDIGSNVGTLLSKFQAKGAEVLGIEPASNIARLAERNGVPTVNEFFSLDVARVVANMRGRAKLITATNVFAHVNDLHEFLLAVDTLLAPGGVFVFEAPHFGNLVRELQYDTIYHEHLSYLSIRPIEQLCHDSGVGLRVFDVQERDIHGGSFRVFLCRQHQLANRERTVSPQVAGLRIREMETGLQSLERMQAWGHGVHAHQRQLTSLLWDLKRQGHSIAGVSAPAKGMTLLNTCRIGPELLDFVTEKSQLKIGRVTPGTHIPVVSDAALLEHQPDYALLLAWNFAEEIMANLHEYRSRGGRFIIPIPEPRIV